MKTLAALAALVLIQAASPYAVAQSARPPHGTVPPATPPQTLPTPTVTAPPPPLSRRARMCRDEADEEGMRGAQREIFLRRCMRV